MKIMQTDKVKIIVLSCAYFKKIMKRMKLDDSNVEGVSDIAVISIGDCVNSQDPSDFFSNGINCHWFHYDHHNVLNLNFDDCSPEHGKGMPIYPEQAERIYKFVTDNMSAKKFFVHCSAGISRSGAVGLFIKDFLKTVDISAELNAEYINPNSYVSMLLNRQIYKNISEE